jgi:AcrR family transcriptional regulator
MDNATAQKRRRPSARQAILDAALALIAEVGGNHLTLEAVAGRAGISKGGLLYHFPTKQALLVGLVEEAIAEAVALLDSADRQDGQSFPAVIRSLFNARFSKMVETKQNGSPHGMLAAMAEQPALLDPIRRFQGAMWERVKTTAADAQGLWLLWLAAEGLMFAQLYQVNPLSPAEQEALLSRLTREMEQLVGG